MPKYCPFCGEELVDSAKFCKSCGKNIEDYQGTDTGDEPDIKFTPPPVVEKSYTWIFVIGLIFSLLIPLIGVIIGIYIYTRKDSSKAKLYGTITIALSAIVWIASLLLTSFMGLY